MDIIFRVPKVLGVVIFSNLTLGELVRCLSVFYEKRIHTLQSKIITYDLIVDHKISAMLINILNEYIQVPSYADLSVVKE
jgi:hypothetical protein